jgi:hypothetical protein
MLFGKVPYAAMSNITLGGGDLRMASSGLSVGQDADAHVPMEE